MCIIIKKYCFIMQIEEQDTTLTFELNYQKSM